MKKITFGNLTPDRWQEFKDLRLEALRTTPHAFGSSYEEKLLDSDEMWKEKLDQTLLSKNSELLFAFDDGMPIGIVALHRGPTSKVSHVAHIAGVYLKEQYRGRGTAERMLLAALSRLKEVGILKAMLEVNTEQEKAVTLYKKLGFEVIGTLHKELNINGKYTDEYMMEKFL